MTPPARLVNVASTVTWSGLRDTIQNTVTSQCHGPFGGRIRGISIQAGLDGSHSHIESPTRSAPATTRRWRTCEHAAEHRGSRRFPPPLSHDRALRAMSRPGG
jgi:hypothetical protein